MKKIPTSRNGNVSQLVFSSDFTTGNIKGSVRWSLSRLPSYTGLTFTVGKGLDHRPTERTHNRTTVYRTVVSLITYRLAHIKWPQTFFSSSWFSGQLDIILLAHTLGTCDFFLPRVLPYRVRSSSSLTGLPPRDRLERRKDKSFPFFFLIHDRQAPEKGISYLVLDYIRFVRKTPATLANALVVSTSETTCGLYTLPSRSRRLSPKTTSAAPTPASSPSGKIEILRVVRRSRVADRLCERETKKNRLSNPPHANTWAWGGKPFNVRGCVTPSLSFFVNHRRRCNAAEVVESRGSESGTTHSISVASARRRKSSAGRMPAKVLGCPRSGPRQRPQERGAFVALYLHFSEIILRQYLSKYGYRFTASIPSIPREKRNGPYMINKFFYSKAFF